MLLSQPKTAYDVGPFDSLCRPRGSSTKTFTEEPTGVAVDGVKSWTTIDECVGPLH